MIVGEAHVVVRAITTGVRDDIRNAFNGIDDISTNAGSRASSGFKKGFGKSGFFGNLAQESDAARKQFDALLTTSYTLGPAMVSLVGAVSSLIGGLAALAGAAAGAAPALIVLPGIMLSAAQAAGTLKLAFMGVAAAISAGNKAQKAQGTGAKAVAKDLTAYYRRIADAREALIELNRLAIREIEGLNREVAQNSAETAAIEVESANRIVEAKNEVLQAQLDLNDAYVQGAEEIQQLNFAAEDAVIGEKRAALELEKARDTLLRVQDLPPNSRARKEAELAFAQADLNYRKAADSNKDISKEQDRLAKEGVDGTSVVINAKNKLAKAVNDQAKAEVDAQNAINDSRNKGIELQRQLAENAEDHTLKQYKAIQAIKRAEEDLERAKRTGNAAGAGAANAYQQALDDLSPPAQKFVKFMVDKFIPSIKTLRDAAAKEFFPKLINAMTKIKDDLFPALVPMLEKTGGILGTVSEQIIGAFTSQEAIGNIKKIWSTNDKVIADFGIAGSNAINAVLDIFVAAGPIIEKFSGWIVGLSKKFSSMINAETASGGLTTFFKEAGDLAAGFKDVFSNTFSGIGTIIRDLMKPGSGGWMLLDFFKQASKNFKDFTNNNTDRIREFFQNTAENSIEILTAVGKFVKEFLKLGENKSIGDMAKTLGDLAPQVGDIAQKFGDAGPSMTNFITKLVELVDLTTQSGAIQTFFNTLSSVADVLIGFFRNPVVASAVATLAGIAAAMVALRVVFKPIKMVVLALINPFYKLLGFFRFLQPILVPFLGNFGAFVSLLLECGPAALTLVNPMVWVAAAVVGAIAAFVAMWRESEIFRKAIKHLIDSVINKAIKIFDDLKLKVEEALIPFGGFSGIIDGLKVVFKTLGDVIGTYVVPIIEGALMVAMEILGFLIGKLIWAIGMLWKGFKFAWDAIYWIVEKVVNFFKDFVWPVISWVIDKLVIGFQAYWEQVKKVWNAVYSVVEKVINFFKDTVWPIIEGVINKLVGGFQALWEKVQSVWNSIWGVIESFANWFRDNIWPTVSSIFQLFINIAGLLWEKMKESFSNIWNKIQDVFTKIRDVLWPILQTAFNKVKEGAAFVWGKIKEVFDFIKGKIEAVFNYIRDILQPIIEKVFSNVSEKASPILTKVTEVFDGIKSKIESVASAIKTALSGLWDGLTRGLSAAFNGVKKTINAVASGVNNLIRGFNGLTPTSIGDITPLPEPLFALARGGTVPARPGGTVALIGEAGRAERVEPLDENGLSKRDIAMINLLSGGGGGLTVNVYPSPGMDEAEIASIVSREISFQMRRGSV